jgi:hypothetical protein
MAWVRQFDYSQGKDRRWPAIGQANGVCYALSMYWVIQTSKGEDFLKWLSPPPEASSGGSSTFGVGMIQSVKKLMENQTKFMQFESEIRGIPWSVLNQDNTAGRELKLKYAKTFIEGNSGLKATGALMIRDTASLEQISGDIISKPGYVMLGYWKNGWGGHACAAYVGNPDVWYFDPNWGQFWFDSTGAFRTWFRSQMCSEYKLNNGVEDAGMQHY